MFMAFSEAKIFEYIKVSQSIEKSHKLDFSKIMK